MWGPPLPVLDFPHAPEKIRYKYDIIVLNFLTLPVLLFAPSLLMNVYLSVFFLLLLFSVALPFNLQGEPMSKKLHNFDLKGLQWSTLGRPRGSGHNNDEEMFVFRAERQNVNAPSKLADSLRNLSLPHGKVIDRPLQKGKQVSNGAHSEKPVSEKDIEGGSVPLTKVSGKAEVTGGSDGSEAAKRWNLRGRKNTGFSKGGGSLSPRGPHKGDEKGTNECSSGGGNRGKTQLLSPNFSIALTREEISEDFEKMLGKPPPKKFKKRPRNIQKNLDHIFPGLFLGSITLDRYEVQEKVPARKGK